MRKILLIMASVGALALTACDKDDGGGNGYGFSPNSCYTSGGAAQYAWVNGLCVDLRRNNQQVPAGQEYRCNQAQQGQAFDPRCSTYGGFNYGVPGGQNFNYGDACTQFYGQGVITSRGVFGELICVRTQTWNYVTQYSQQYYGQMPINYGGYYQTCIPGVYNCNCRSFGGTLGWRAGGGYAGAYGQVGFCF